MYIMSPIINSCEKRRVSISVQIKCKGFLDMTELKLVLTLMLCHLFCLCFLEHLKHCLLHQQANCHIALGVGMTLNGAGSVHPSSKYVSQSLERANFHSVSSWFYNNRGQYR